MMGLYGTVVETERGACGNLGGILLFCVVGERAIIGCR
jgi:hypothetical protein